MILILSEEIDTSTHTVVDWLVRYNKDFVVISERSFLEKIQLYLDDNGINVSLTIEGLNEPIEFSRITSIWYRKGDLVYDFKKFYKEIPVKLRDLTLEHLIEEWEGLKNFLLDNLKNKIKVGNYFNKLPSKLSYLQIASECGFKIPSSFIFSSKEHLYSKLSDEEEMVVKSIDDIFVGSFDNTALNTYTSLFSEADYQNIPVSFFPSLFQKRVEKKYELRIFFLENRLYSMAIFSQKDQMTSVDFRNYNLDRPNRTVPYDLPESIAVKVRSFIKNVGLNTGSIDIIVTPKDEYVFLEVNPSGQFGGLSKECNYQIEKHIANYLL